MNSILLLAIVDDNKLLVELLSDYFSKQLQIEVVIRAHSGNEFLDRLTNATALPNCVVLDLKMNDGGGIDILPELIANYPSIKIIALTSYYKPSLIGFMFKSGAHALVPKEIEKEDLLAIVKKVHTEGLYFTDEQTKLLRNQMSNNLPEPSLQTKDTLTTRELEVLKLLCKQFTAKEIAEHLFLSPKTIETHKSNLLSKTGAKNTAGLIIFALQNKIIDTNELVIFE